MSERVTLLACAGVDASLTWKVSFVPLGPPIGVPEMTPLLGVSDRPAGSGPWVSVQV